MKNLNRKQRTVNTIVSATSSVLGGVHALATTVADLSIKAELSINAKYYTSSDGNRLSQEDLINIAQRILERTQEFQFKVRAKSRDLNTMEIEQED